MTIVRNEGETAKRTVTHRQILAIALPMTLAYMTTPLLGITDTAVVGRLGDAALLAGLAAGAIVFDVILSSCNFLRSGTVGLVSQANGKGATGEERIVLARALMIAAVIGLACILGAPAIIAAAVWFMNAGADVSAAMASYIGVRLLATPFALANYALLGYVLGRGEAGTGLALQLVVNGVNIALSILFGLVYGYGIQGVAFGTVIGEAVGVVFGLGVVLLRMRGVAATLPALFERAGFTLMLGVNRDIMIRSFVLLGAYALFTRQSADASTLVLAANAVLLKLSMLAAFLLDGLATAAERLAGRALGLGQKAAFDRTVRLAIAWSLATSAAIAVLFWLAGPALIDLMTTSPQIREQATHWLIFAALTPLTGALAFVMDGIFIGATWSAAMRDRMLASFAIFIVLLFALPAMLGAVGLWIAFHAFMIARGALLAAVLPQRAGTVFVSPEGAATTR